MAYGTVNVPGASGPEFETLRKLAQEAKDTAEKAAEAIKKLTNTVNAVPTQKGSLVYTGSTQSPEWDNYDPGALAIGGTQGAASAGTYTVTFTPKEGYQWSDGSTGAKTATWTIGRAAAAVPALVSNPAYTGNAQSATWSGYDTAKMTAGGTFTATDAGTYTATFTLKADYQWEDGTTGVKTVTWAIRKAAGSLALDKTSLSLDMGTPTGAVKVTRSGNGAVTAATSNAGVATAAVSGTVVTVTAVGSGTATITVNCAEGANHMAPAGKTISVTVEMASKTLADNTPAVIQAVARSGQAANYWSVGDTVGILLNGGIGNVGFAGSSLLSAYRVFILGFDHNSTVEGTNTIHFQFGKLPDGTDVAMIDNEFGKSGSSIGYRMNLSRTTAGGWKDSYMRNTICPMFLAAMPQEWQDVIAPCTKYSDNVGDRDTTGSVTVTQDKIWLLAEYEVFGTCYGANTAERAYQKQYDYYANGNSIVRQPAGASLSYNGVHWWLRSVYRGDASQDPSFCCVNPAVFSEGVTRPGNIDLMGAQYSEGFAPGFMVA